jgi:hypothetical protein
MFQLSVFIAVYRDTSYADASYSSGVSCELNESSCSKSAGICRLTHQWLGPQEGCSSK